MGLLQWFWGTTSDAPAEGYQEYTIAPGFEQYVRDLPAATDGDYGGAVADALINAGILIPVDQQPAQPSWFDWFE